jgi:hypothetical protein
MNRRDFMAGLGGVALARLLHAESQDPRLHYVPKAQRVVQLFMSGAASQCDTFDYKPELIKRDGQKFDPGGAVELFQSNPGSVMKSPWGWKRHGESGRWISDLLPNLAGCADDLAFVYSMVSKSNVHGPATFLQNTGFVLPGFPGMGAWVSYAFGSGRSNLPTFVALPDVRGFAPNGPGNWSSGFLPAEHQGTMIRVGRPNPIHDLFPPEGTFVTPEAEREGADVLRALNAGHRESRPNDARLDARIASYEAAARLQLAAPEALDVEKEPASVQRLYGLDRPVTREFGLRCLVARRLLERGVKFVQVWSGADNGHPRRNWDSHEELARDHGEMGASLDQPAAALIQDLKRLGLLEDTIVHWTTEFGRMPCSQGSRGRDHNPFAFTNWLAGGGFKGGATHGESDEWSYKAVKDPVYGYDIHATMLRALGLDHEKLTFRHNGIDRRLTDVHGHVIEDLLIK